MMIVAIASFTRGSAVSEADTPSVIKQYRGPVQDQGEKAHWPGPNFLFADS